MVSQAVRECADRDGEASVVVLLRFPTAAAPAEPAGRAARGTLLARRRSAVLAAAGDGVTIEHAYRSVPGFAARVTPEALQRLATHPEVVRVDLDAVGTVALDRSVPQIRGDRVQARGVDGAGTVIAVLDTGVDAAHPDVAAALVHEECFCRGGNVGGRSRQPCCPNGEARQSGPGAAASVSNHGPHVAGIALSRGHLAPVGVAPGAQLLAVRVLDGQNVGFQSDWIAALDWIAAERPDVRVVNMSLVSEKLFGVECESNCEDPDSCAINHLYAEVLEELWQRDTMVFAASGNLRRTNQMNAPACISRAVAVGAIDRGDAVAGFSNRSPGLDLFAPGTSIVSDGLTVDAHGDPTSGLFTQSGTSMAAPHAAGAAALLLSARPGLTADQVTALLADTGVPVNDLLTGRVTPRVDAFAALTAAMRAPELVRGGGGRASDCLLEFSIAPPEAVGAQAAPTVACTDNDPLCDGDPVLGRCAFELSTCFNMRDPLLRDCPADETLARVETLAPRPDAAPGTVERANADAIAATLPEFPFTGSDICGSPVPFVVERPPDGGAGRGDVRMRVSSATRVDSDRIRFRCLPP
jgi:hypothetical protein